jgi:asparagine synthase (glutamine-hydrolysing)
MADLDKLRAMLTRAVDEMRCEAILLSGGLDTSIVAALAADRGLRLAVTVVVGDDAPDLPYATELAARLGLEHVVLRRTLDELWAALPELVRALGTFDGMYLRNDVVVHEGLRELSRRGVRACFVGDASDELFAGYSFVFSKPPEEIAATVRRFAASMHFNGPKLGQALGIDVRSPYLHPEVVAYALSLPGQELVLERDGERHGKAPLRRAFEFLGERHAYRRKDPIEIGSGATALRAYATARVSDFDAEAAGVLASDGVRIRDAERVAYYRIYRDVFGGPPRPDASQPKVCPDCRSRGPEGTYCRVCGAYPI